MTDYDINISGSNATITGSSLENALGKANFQVDITDAPSEVVEGDTATVTAITFNSSEVQHTQTVELIVDAVTEDSVSLTLDGGSGSGDDYLWDTTGKSSGDYSALIESDDDSDSQTITVLAILQWDDADWVNNQTEDGVGDEAPSATDYDGALMQKQYDYNSPRFSNHRYVFPMHDSSGPLFDASGSVADGDQSLTGGSFDETGLLGASSIKFDATDDIFKFADISLDNTTNGGLAFGGWFYWIDDPRNVNIWVDRWAQSGSNNTGWQLGNNVPQGNIGMEWSDDRISWSIPSDWSGEWHHLWFTADDASNVTLSIYVDGELKNSGGVGGNQTVQGTTTWEMNESQAIEHRRSGQWLVDEFVSESEVKKLYDMVATDGTFTTKQKSFVDAKKPDLKQLDYSLNGVTDTQVDVIGSPDTADEEIVTQQLDGSSEYSLSWTDSHTDFEIKGYCESEGDVTRTSTYKKLVLTE